MATIEQADVIRLILQYLKENSLLLTLKTLQEETSVSLNTVDSIETFVSDIKAGHWDVVLKIVKLLKLPDSKLTDLYEQITLELIESRETRAAKWMLLNTEPMIKLNETCPERYQHLQTLLPRPYFDHKEAYRDGTTKEGRRISIANDLKREVSVVPSQRLLTLVGDALKWQKHEGLLPSSASIDIFTGKAHMETACEETHPNVLHKHCVKSTMNLSITGDDQEEAHIFVCCAEFSPDGHYIVLGYSDGLIEVRNATTGRLANDLKYQAEQKYMVTPSKKAALTMCFRLGFSDSSPMFAVGDKSGNISFWRLDTGELAIPAKSAHIKSVSCLLFNRNGREIFSGGQDGSIKLHSLKTGKLIKDFLGAHKSFIYGLAMSQDDKFLVSGGVDGAVRIWKIDNNQLLHEIKSKHDKIHTVISMPNGEDVFMVGYRSRQIELIDLNGKTRARFTHDPSSGQEDSKLDDRDDQDTISLDFNASCCSPKGNWIHAVDSQHIYCFNHKTGKIQKRLLGNDDKSYDLIGIKHHPFLNLMATFDTQGNVKLWVP